LSRVAHHPEASAEFAEAVEYYVEHAPPEIPVRFNSAIEAGVAEIAKSPLRFPRWKDTRARKYVVPGFPYLIFFLDFPEYVRILAVAHTKRRPVYWRERIAVD
jgi:toxin ParE1/3/4